MCSMTVRKQTNMSYKKKNKTFVSDVQMGVYDRKDADNKKIPDKPASFCEEDRNNSITRNSCKSLSTSFGSLATRTDHEKCSPTSLSPLVRSWPKLPSTSKVPFQIEQSDQYQPKKRNAISENLDSNEKHSSLTFINKLKPKTQSLLLDKRNDGVSVDVIKNQWDWWENNNLDCKSNKPDHQNRSTTAQLDQTKIDRQNSDHFDSQSGISRRNGYNNFETVVGDNRLILKMIKLQKKEEKRIQREEEIRRRKIGSKSQHFKIISPSLRDKIMASTDGHSRSKCVEQTEKGRDFELNQLLSEFPDLSISRTSKKHNSYSETNNVDEMEKQSRLMTHHESDKGICMETGENPTSVKKMYNKNDGLDNNILESKDVVKLIDSCEINKDKKKKRKKVKKSDPIEFSLISALEVLQKKQKPAFKSHVMKRTIEKKRLFSGNELDSASPMRKKGKQRENGTKKKLTRIKRLVLNEKQKRTVVMNECKLNLFRFGKLLLNGTVDCNDLLYHLVKTKQFNRPASNVDCALTEVVPTTSNTVGDNNDDGEKQRYEIDAKVLIHSRRFKFYCDQWPNEEMNRSLYSLIKLIVKFQDRLHNNDPIKAHAKRRYVCGFNEVLSYVKLNKAKLVVIATDINCKDRESILFDCIMQVTKTCESLAIPYVYCGSCRLLKTWFKKRSSFVSFAAILNYDGAEELYKTIINLLPEVKKVYNEKLKDAERKCGIRHKVEEDVTDVCIRSMLNSLSMNSVKNGCSNIDNDCDDQNENGDEGKYNDLNTEEDREEKNSACPFMSAILKCSDS